MRLILRWSVVDFRRKMIEIIEKCTITLLRDREIRSTKLELCAFLQEED